MRASLCRCCALALWLLAAGCKHNLDSLFEDTVTDAGKASGGTGGRASGSGGNGGKGGDGDEDGGPSSGSGGSDVVETQPGPCEPCIPKLSSELTDNGIVYCCRGINMRTCGLAFGDKATCLPKAVPGDASQCPDARSGALKLDGCCRPDSRCGYQSDGPVLGAFGCVAREEVPDDFASGSIDTSPVACTFECEDDDACNALPGDFVCTANPENGDQRICAKKCGRDADCNSERVCAFGNDVATNRVNAFCQKSIGPLPPGEACEMAEQCRSGVCKQLDPADPESGGLCSQFCITKNDCLAGQTCIRATIDPPDAGAGVPLEFHICDLAPTD